MTTARLIQAALTSLTISVTALAAESHEHHHGAPAAKLQLNQGAKWETDAPLRQGMTTIQGELAGKLAAIHAGRLSRADYAALGRTIDAQVGNIVSQCKLEPKADAALHGIIGELLHAAEIMQGKAKGKPQSAAHHVVMTLENYAKYFDHPGWPAGTATTGSGK